MHEGGHCLGVHVAQGWGNCLNEGFHCTRVGTALHEGLGGGEWTPGCRVRVLVSHGGVRDPRPPHSPLVSRLPPPQLSIRCGNHRFKVFAEGQPLCDFAHRLPPGPHVETLQVEGDVVLSYVHF